MQHAATNRSGEILSGSPDFVPTAFERTQDGHIDAGRNLSSDDWQLAMKRAIRSAAELIEAVGLHGKSGLDTAHDQRGDHDFPVFVPREYLRRIRTGDANDPLLRQVLPLAAEQEDVPGFVSDPVGDLNAMASAGVLHKYAGRALLVTSGACGVHCRYCFRREFPYAQAGSRGDSWRRPIDYLRQNQDIDEVLLSGGDPLTVVDDQICELITRLESVPHLRRIRIHTRMPIVIPQRITDRMVSRLADSRLAVWMVVHTNHPNELDEQVLSRLGVLVDSGIPVLNQAVLLRGVNDDSKTLVDLCRKLVDHRIQPYYLHQLDRVRGAAHFEVPIAQGKRLMNSIREQLPGYAVPEYVVERAGEKSKTPISLLYDGSSEPQ